MVKTCGCTETIRKLAQLRKKKAVLLPSLHKLSALIKNKQNFNAKNKHHFYEYMKKLTSAQHRLVRRVYNDLHRNSKFKDRDYRLEYILTDKYRAPENKSRKLARSIGFKHGLLHSKNKKTHQINHKDGNVHNNSKSNLEALHIKKHQLLHKKLVLQKAKHVA